MFHRCHSVFHRKKIVSVLPKEWLIFPGFVFLSIYFNRVTLQLTSPPHPPLFLFSSLISHFSSFFSTCSLLTFVLSFAAYLSTRMCGKNPTLRLHCLFHVRTSGDIKGLQRGLSVCISPALIVWDPSMHSALSSLTHSSLERLLVENNMPAPAGCNCAHVYAFADLLSPYTQVLWGRSMFKGLSIV